jgi:hypothetical protein
MNCKYLVIAEALLRRCRETQPCKNVSQAGRCCGSENLDYGLLDYYPVCEYFICSTLKMGATCSF